MSRSKPWIRQLRSSEGHRRRRAVLLVDSPVCVHCRRRPSSVLDHQPPLATFPSYELWLSAGGIEVASCSKCSYAQAGEMAHGRHPVVTRRW